MLSNEEIEKHIERFDGYIVVTKSFFMHGILIPEGFVCNGASRPFGDRLAAPYVYEAIYHDYIYTTHLVSKSFADLMYYQGIVQRGTNRHIARVHYLGLILFGWIYW